MGTNIRSFGTVRSERGFTLIEILLALGVLVIGIVGIIVLFPVGIQHSKLAIHDTVSASIAESVKSGIVQALRDKASGVADVELYHDGVSTGLKFKLPPTDPIDAADFERTIPKEATAGTSAGKDVFHLGQATSSSFPLNVAAGDARDLNLAQWSFNFRIRPTTNPAVKNTYEVLIQVYHDWEEGVDTPTTKDPTNTFSTIVNTSPTK